MRNLTAHPVSLHNNRGPISTFPPSGTVLRVINPPHFCADTAIVSLMGMGMDPNLKVIVPVARLDSPLPAEVLRLNETLDRHIKNDSDHLVIVSTMILQHVIAPLREHVLSPDTGPTSAVTDDTGRIIGVRRFLRAA